MLAAHMPYHLGDVKTALAEVCRVLGRGTGGLEGLGSLSDRQAPAGVGRSKQVHGVALEGVFAQASLR